MSFSDPRRLSRIDDIVDQIVTSLAGKCPVCELLFLIPLDTRDETLADCPYCSYVARCGDFLVKGHDNDA